MRSSFALASLSLFGASQAIINGISVPETIKPGDTIEAVILSSDYIQTVLDVAICFGYTYAAPHGGVGEYINGYYLGPAHSNKLNNFNESLTIPSDITKGPGVVTAALMSLFGAGEAPSANFYSVNVTFGDETSSTYASSE